jgi:hypothetical protein
MIQLSGAVSGAERGVRQRILRDIYTGKGTTASSPDINDIIRQAAHHDIEAEARRGSAASRPLLRARASAQRLSRAQLQSTTLPQRVCAAQYGAHERDAHASRTASFSAFRVLTQRARYEVTSSM